MHRYVRERSREEGGTVDRMAAYLSRALLDVFYHGVCCICEAGSGLVDIDLQLFMICFWWSAAVFFLVFRRVNKIKTAMLI